MRLLSILLFFIPSLVVQGQTRGLSIRFSGVSGDRVELEKLCKSAGRFFLRGFGPWGFGYTADEIECLRSDSDKPAKTHVLSLQSQSQASDIRLEEWQDGRAVKSLQRKLAFDSKTLLEKSHEKILRLVSWSLLLESGELRSIQAPLKDFVAKKTAPLPKPPPNFFIREVRASPGLILPVLKGSARRFDEGEGRWRYRISWVTKAAEGRGLSLGFADSSKEYAAALDQALDKQLKRKQNPGLDQKLIAALGSTYAGLSYGLPLLRGNPLLARSRLSSFLLELRRGPAQGLRLYWDWVPLVETIEQNEALHFSWNKTTLAWSFGLKHLNVLPPDSKAGGLVDTLLGAFDIVPKVGITNFDATVALDNAVNSELIVPASFTLRRLATAELEGGFAIAAPWFLLRLHGSFGQALPLVKNAGHIDLLRLGAESFWSLSSWGLPGLSLKAFGSAERLKLQANGSRDDLSERTGVDFEGLTFLQIYLGLGLVWAG